VVTLIVNHVMYIHAA